MGRLVVYQIDLHPTNIATLRRVGAVLFPFTLRVMSRDRMSTVRDRRVCCAAAFLLTTLLLERPTAIVLDERELVLQAAIYSLDAMCGAVNEAMFGPSPPPIPNVQSAHDPRVTVDTTAEESGARRPRKNKPRATAADEAREPRAERRRGHHGRA